MAAPATGPVERPELEGELAETSLAAVLHRLADRAAVGRLDLDRSPLHKSLFLDEGDPVYVTSNLECELLGEHLVARGALPRADHARALDFAADRGLRLTEALVALQLLEPYQLFRHLAEQARDRILELFTWVGGRFAFFAAVAPPPSGMPLGLGTYDLLHEGVRSCVPLTVIHRRLDPHRRQPLVRSGAPLPDALQLSGREQRLLRAVIADPEPCLDDLVRREREEEHVLRLVYLLTELGALRFAPPA